MASGIIYGTTSNEYIDAKLEWESFSQGTVINQSVLHTALYYKRNNTGFATSGTGTFKISIYDPVEDKTESKTVEATLNITYDGWVKAAEFNTVWIKHKENGTGSATISASGSISGTTLTSTTLSKTVTLDTIARASTIDLLTCATRYFTGEMTYKYSPKSGELYNQCNIALNLDGTYTRVRSINLGQKSPSQQTATVTLSESELSAIYKLMPSSTSGKLRFTFRTYSDSGYSTQVGEAPYKEIELTIPNDTTTQPTATLTVSSVHSLDSAFDGLYIKGKSKVRATLDSGAGKYGATPKSFKVTIGSKSGASPFTSDYLTTTGELTIKGTVTDTRGYSRTYTKTITVIDYASPRILPASGWDNVIAARCNSAGVLDSNGTNLRIVAKRSYSKVMVSGAQKNYCKIQYRYKAEGGSYSSWVDIRLGTETDDNVSYVAPNVTLEATKTYAVQIGAVDGIGDVGLTTITISSQKVYMHKAGSLNSLGIGKYAEEENTIDIADDINICGRVYGLGKARIAIQSGEDFNSFLNFGVYAVTTNAIAQGISNIPVPVSGRLIVSSANGSGKRSGTYTYILQEYITFNGYYHCYREVYTEGDAAVWKFNKWEIRSSRFWVNLGLSDEVSVSNSNMGRFTNGTCCYRVVNENHVYVAFNCACTYSGSPITVSGSQIPSPYKPARNVYTYCAVNGRALARVFINSSGDVRIDHVQDMSAAEDTSSYTINWIDGYIDYWV